MNLHLNFPIIRAVQFLRNLIQGQSPIPKEPELDEKAIWERATPKNAATGQEEASTGE